MPKIAMIGAGSLIFCKTLINDILATPALRDSEICLMNRTKPKLDQMEAFVRRMVKENQFRPGLRPRSTGARPSRAPTTSSS